MIITDRNMLAEAEQYLRQADPVMAAFIQQYGPCQIAPWDEPLFTSLINAILSQQLSVKAAETISGRLLSLMPDSRIFCAETISRMDETRLRQCGLSNAKVRYCQSLAQAVHSKTLDLEALREKPVEEIRKTLIAYPGIGQWTVEMFLIFAIGSSDIISYGDLGLRRAMGQILELNDYPDETLFYERSEVWSPWRSVASWYLWRFTD